jgi:hypothetical protein
MIRIDEIYNNTLWTWFCKHRPGDRMFVCDPFGRSDADSVISYHNKDVTEVYYTFFFDQEPINLARHNSTFQKVFKNSKDIWYKNPNTKGYLITSEKSSTTVETICKQYGWIEKYYFFHGWAALDWYRGYNRTYLMPDPKDRTITKTFIAPNRIVAGERQHRLVMLYHIFKHRMTNNWISCPAVCPAENITISEAIKPLTKKYSDIEQVFSSQTFPIDFPNESDSPMKSCWLDLFDESAESLLYLVTETVATGQRLHLTEKTFKPICLRMPFIIVGTCGSLAYLKSYGFKTFGDVWDESYDNETDDAIRLERIASLLRSLDELSAEGKQDLFNMAQEIVEHNYNHFYNGGFEKILWDELISMLESINV